MRVRESSIERSPRIERSLLSKYQVTMSKEGLLPLFSFVVDTSVLHGLSFDHAPSRRAYPCAGQELNFLTRNVASQEGNLRSWC